MSLLIDNFSVGYNVWMPITDLVSLSLDVVDDTYPVSTSGTLIYYNDTLVSGIFNTIIDGYRISYDVPTIGSGIDFTIHAENSVGEVNEKTYSFLFGYRIEYDNPVRWGAHEQVDVYMEAFNNALCPNKEADAFYFVTQDYSAMNLEASIYPVVPQDLSAVIYPQSTFFFYGRTFTVTVSGVCDYAGNIMEPYTFSFTIEDPTGDL